MFLKSQSLKSQSLKSQASVLHRQQSYSLRNKQTGSSLVLGIFVLTVMFLLAAGLIQMAEHQDQAFTEEVWGTRALFAANSGADAALAELFPLDDEPQDCSAVSNEWTPPAVTGFANCEVTLECSEFTASDTSQVRIISKAECESESGELRVSRQVEVLARN